MCIQAMPVVLLHKTPLFQNIRDGRQAFHFVFCNHVCCSKGRVSFHSGGASQDDCSPCTAGYYCDTPGLSYPTGLCNEGYYCPGNETITEPSPQNYKCQPGFYCPPASAWQIPCPSGLWRFFFPQWCSAQLSSDNVIVIVGFTGLF